MKKNLGLICLAILALCIVTYTYLFEFKKRKADEILKEKEALVVQYEKSDISKITFTNKDSFTLEKIGDVWNVTAPVSDEVDMPQMNTFLESLTGEKAEIEITDDVLEPKIYGLDKPLATIAVFNKDGQSIQVAIGGDAIQGKQYLGINNTSKIVVSSSQWRFLGGKSLAELRSKAIFRGKDIQAVDIEMPASTEKKRIRLINKDERWTMEDAKFNLDNLAVRSYITQIQNLRAIGIESEDQSQLAKFGLSKPVVTLRILQKENKDPAVIRMSAPQNNAKDSFIVSSELKPIYKSYGTLAGTFAKKPSDFRDREEPFRFNLADVIGIRTKAGDYDYRFIKKGESWYLEKPDEKRDVDLNQVTALLNALQAARVGDYLGAVPFKSKRSIELLDKDGNVLLKIDVGDEVKAQNKYLVKSSKVEEVFSVDATNLNGWPGTTLVKEKVQVTSPETNRKSPITSEEKPKD